MFPEVYVLDNFEIEISSLVRTKSFFFLFRAWRSKEGFIPLTISLSEKQHLIKCHWCQRAFFRD